MDDTLLFEIEKSLQSILYGSLEIIVQDGVVTQMNVRKIHKTNLGVAKKIINNHVHADLSSKPLVSSKINIKLRS